MHRRSAGSCDCFCRFPFSQPIKFFHLYCPFSFVCTMVDSSFFSHSPFLRHRQSFSDLFRTALHTELVQFLYKAASDRVSVPSLDHCDARPMHGKGDSCQLVSSGDASAFQPEMREVACEDPAFSPDAYRNDDSLSAIFCSVVRIVVCFLSMMVTTVFWAFVLILLLPFPSVRIKQSNIYGHVTGRMLMWILGNPLKICGKQYANTKGIYICNHASPLDIFLVMWLTPTGTVGIAKKQIIWYPLFGQLYVLANHLRIDRTNPRAAIQSIRKVAGSLVQNSLSLVVFPEGTRSATGRLLPFKKGFVHLAIQTKLPIVPMVFTGTHLAWQKNSLRVRPAPVTVTYLPPIKTDDWTADKVEDYVKLVHALYVEHLPTSQKPLEKVNTAAASKSVQEVVAGQNR